MQRSPCFLGVCADFEERDSEAKWTVGKEKSLEVTARAEGGEAKEFKPEQNVEDRSVHT